MEAERLRHAEELGVWEAMARRAERERDVNIARMEGRLE